jgi:hypothetical protein
MIGYHRKSPRLRWEIAFHRRRVKMKLRKRSLFSNTGRMKKAIPIIAMRACMVPKLNSVT